MTNAKQHRAIATDMVNEVIQEHVVQTPDGEMYEWTYKRGVRYRTPDFSKPVSVMMDGKELRNMEAFGIFTRNTSVIARNQNQMT